MSPEGQMMKTLMKLSVMVAAVSLFAACGSPAGDAVGYYKGTQTSVNTFADGSKSTNIGNDSVVVIVPKEDAEDEVYIMLQPGCVVEGTVDDSGALEVGTTLCTLGTTSLTFNFDGEVSPEGDLELNGKINVDGVSEGQAFKYSVDISYEGEREEL